VHRNAAVLFLDDTDRLLLVESAYTKISANM
jgi:hypothetical protein